MNRAKAAWDPFPPMTKRGVSLELALLAGDERGRPGDTNAGLLNLAERAASIRKLLTKVRQNESGLAQVNRLLKNNEVADIQAGLWPYRGP